MGAVGEVLRRQRLKSGADLDRISQETKIPSRYLLAIEREEFEKLPGRVFLFSFVRQYAQTLGLDEVQVLAQLREEQEPPPAPPAPESPCPRPRWKRVPVILAGAAVLLLAFVLADTIPWSGSAVPPVPQSASVVSAGAADRAAPSVPAEQPPAAELPPTSAGQPPAPAAQPATLAEQPSAPAAQPVALPEQPVTRAEQPPLASVASAGLRLVLTARKRTWVTAKQDGRSAFSGTLQPNEGRVLEGGATIDVVIGNPEAVEVSLNGKPLEIAGPPGDVAEVRIAAPDAPPVISHRRPLSDLY